MSLKFPLGGTFESVVQPLEMTLCIHSRYALYVPENSTGYARAQAMSVSGL